MAQAKATSVSQSMKMSQKESSRFPLIFGGAAGSIQNISNLPNRLKNTFGSSQRPSPPLELETEDIYGYTERISHGFLSPSVLNAASYSHHAKNFKSHRPKEMHVQKLAVRAKHLLSKEDPELDTYLREKKKDRSNLEELISNSISEHHPNETLRPFQKSPSPPPEEKLTLEELQI